MNLHPRIAAAAEGVLPPWAEVGARRVEHIGRVATLMAEWGGALGLSDEDRARWRASAWLHDALREARPETLREGVPESLRGLPGSVLHGPAAAERLRREGVEDESVLRAVAYHTIGHPELDDMGRALYAADFLEPGRPFLTEQRATLRARMPQALDEVVRDVARIRIRHLLERDAPLQPHTVAFWNVLVVGPVSVEAS